MNRLVCAAALMGMAWAGTATAQEFKGAEISAEVLGFTDDSDLGETTYRGSLEFGVFGGFGLQADLAFHDSRTIDLDSRTTTLHALYDAFEFATVGLFYSRDDVDIGGIEGSVDLWGLEGGRSFGAAGIEGYLALVDDEDEESRMAGLDGIYDLGPSLSITGSGAILSGDAEASRLSVGTEYRFGNGGPAVFGEIGRLSVGDGDDEETETFVTLGARLAIGPNQGTTFGSRGLFEVLTGF